MLTLYQVLSQMHDMSFFLIIVIALQFLKKWKWDSEKLGDLSKIVWRVNSKSGISPKSILPQGIFPLPVSCGCLPSNAHESFYILV